MTYYPTIFFNEFWTLRENLIPINETLKEATIALDLTQMGLWKFTIFSQVEKSFEMQVWQAPGSAHSRSSSHQACTSTATLAHSNCHRASCCIAFDVSSAMSWIGCLCS